jgi:hypothetical protein
MDQYEAEFEAFFQGHPDALCARRYHADVDGEKVAIDVVIYPPEIGQYGPQCRYTIEGAGLSIDSLGGSADRLGAILNAFCGVRAHLETLPYDLTWIGHPGMLWLPMEMSNGCEAHFERHCEELVKAEHEAATADISRVRRLWSVLTPYEETEGFRTKARLS